MMPTSRGALPFPAPRSPSPETRLPCSSPPSTIGMPLTLYSRITRRAVPIVAPGGSVIGSTITPFSDRFTFSTSRAWFSADRFLWITPTPPSCASAIASAASVTVSIGAEINGMFSSMPRVRRVWVSASLGTKSDRAGMSSTSSNVIPSWTIFECSMEHC
jgi:hypothetical protein